MNKKYKFHQTYIGYHGHFLSGEEYELTDEQARALNRACTLVEQQQEKEKAEVEKEQEQKQEQPKSKKGKK